MLQHLLLPLRSYTLLHDEIFTFFRLEGQILERFEVENDGKLLIATLCLLEVSNGGLLEVELLAVLGDEDNLMPRKLTLKSSKDDEESTDKSKCKVFFKQFVCATFNHKCQTHVSAV
jgi:hypothetical protein